jgi:hypothetical protein
VIVIVIAPVIVAVHVNVNAPVIVIAHVIVAVAVIAPQGAQATSTTPRHRTAPI